MVKNRRVLVTGSGGMLGSAVVPTFRKHGYEVLSSSRRKNTKVVDEVMDVTDFKHFDSLMKKFMPGLLLHLAAETDLEFCETNQNQAYQTNSFGTHNAAILAVKYDAALVYISTAGVFDGKKSTPYIEFDRPKPIMVYGRSKLEGEKFVKSYCQRYFIVRAGWMIGGLEKDKKFVGAVIDQIYNGARKVYALTDKFGTPTYAPYFAENLISLVNTEYYGLYHMACEGEASRFDVANEIVRSLEMDKKVEVVPVTGNYFDKKYFVPRPTSEIMRNMGLEMRGINQMSHWKVALHQYVKDLWELKK